MRVLIDSNILLDICFEKGEYYKLSYGAILCLVTNQADCYIVSSCITDVFYTLNKYFSKAEAKRKVLSLINLCDVLSIGEKEICLALESSVDDYEDAIVESCAYNNRCDYILTRNIKDFTNSKVKLISPKEINSLYK